MSDASNFGFDLQQNSSSLKELVIKYKAKLIGNMELEFPDGSKAKITKESIELTNEPRRNNEDSQDFRYRDS